MLTPMLLKCARPHFAGRVFLPNISRINTIYSHFWAIINAMRKFTRGATMEKTIVFVTNQFCCDRIICAAQVVAQKTNTELNIVQILDSEYDLDPKAIDYLFMMAKKAGATMRLVSSPDKLALMHKTIAAPDVHHVVTGMPSSNKSVLYGLWKRFPNKSFYVVDSTGELIDVASNNYATA